MRKTRHMRLIEYRYRQPLEKLLAPLVTELGLTVASERLEISRAGLNYWMLRFGIRMVRVAVGPGDVLEIKRN